MQRAIQRWSLFASLALALLVVALMDCCAQPPDVVSADAPADQFSGARARTGLQELLGDERPHPVGSAANHAVRDRLVAAIRALGVEVEVQRGVGCHLRATRCAFTENVIATLPGTRPDTLALMAHYDSVPHAPGAGDDGAGVAALLEVLRAVRDGAPYNTLRWVFTDAEEIGLLGARSYFEEHPSAKDVLAFINVEGSGSAGASHFLRATDDSGSLVQAYRRGAKFPVAASAATEIFKRMQNDTDFTVGAAAGVKGIDFAFAGERNHYHTPLDTIDNLDPRTIQHHGENVLPVVRELANADLRSIEGDFAFLSTGPWVIWPAAATLPLAVLMTITLLLAIGIERKAVPIRRTAMGVGVALLALLGMTLANVAATGAAGSVAGTTPGWPGTLWPWRAILVGATLLGWLAVVGPLAHRVGRAGMGNGAWIVIASIALLLASSAPLAANIFLIPALVAAAIKLIVAFRDRDVERDWRPAIDGVTAAVGAMYIGVLAVWLEATQGYQVAPAIYGPGMLALLLISPLLAEAPRPQRIGAGVFFLALLAGGLIGVGTAPLYTEHRPQHLNFVHAQNHDTGKAWWLASTDGPLPPSVSGVAEFAPPGSNGAIVPWTTLMWNSAAAPAITEAAPEVDVLTDTSEGDARRVSLRLRSPRGASRIRLIIAEAAGLQSLTVEGRPVVLGEVRSATPSHRILTIYGLPAAGAEVTLTLSSHQAHEHFVSDAVFDLPPEAGELIAARGRLAVPVHQGDLRVRYRRVSF